MESCPAWAWGVAERTDRRASCHRTCLLEWPVAPRGQLAIGEGAGLERVSASSPCFSKGRKSLCSSVRQERQAEEGGM